MSSSEEATPLSNKLSCPICFEVYRSPRSLPCLHTFCESCLQSYINNALETRELAGNNFSCPVCRKITKPPALASVETSSTWAALFPPNYALLTLLDSRDSQDEGPACDSCSYQGLSERADKFCRNCKENLCRECVKRHQSFKISRNHNIVPVQDVTASGMSRTIDLNQYCQFHPDKLLEYFCKDDNSFCCSTCAISNHRKCEKVIEVSTVATRAEMDKKPEEMRDKMRMFQSHLQEVIEKVDYDVIRFKEQMKRIQEQVKEIKMKVNQRLDEFGETVKRECQKLLQHESSERESLLTESRCLVSAIGSSCALFEYVLKHGNDPQLYITFTTVQEQFTQYEKRVSRVHKSLKSTLVTLQIPPEIDALLASSLTGNLNCKKEDMPMSPCRIRKPLQDCPVKYVGAVDVSFPGQKKPRYSGATCLADDRIILADNYNQNLYICDSLFRFQSMFYIGQSLWKVVTLKENVVGICSYNDQEISLVEVNHDVAKTGSIVTKSNCACLARAGNDDLAVVFDMVDKPSFSIISVDGEERTIFNQDRKGRIFQIFWHMALSRDKTRVFQSCYKTNALYCFSVDGTPFFNYSHPELQFPAGVDVDREDNIFVCGQKSNNIHQLSPEGQLINIITARGMEKPLNLCFFPGGTEFFVTTDTAPNKIHRFKIDTNWKTFKPQGPKVTFHIPI